MSAGRPPGHECGTTKGKRRIKDGTLCRQESPRPGPMGIEWGGYLPDFSDARKVVGEWTKAADQWVSEKTAAAAGQGKSILLTLLDVLPIKKSSPFSTALLKHYVERSGSPYELKDIPMDWQVWIEKTTKGRPGKHRDLNPYNSGIYDLRNSLGHFDVEVKANKDKTKTYIITDNYHFGYTKNDKSQRGRHGFPIGEVSEFELEIARGLLPKTEYRNRGGFKEKWEIRKSGSETVLLIPQQFLEEQGKAFRVTGTFVK